MSGGEANSEESDPAGVQREGLRQNFFALVVYGVVLRTGWIFKTESIVMPAILDSIGGGGWLRGCLPMLNRLGQSVSPVLASEYVRRAQYQKLVLASFAGLMGCSFLTLAAMWFWLDGNYPSWLPYFFLAIYAFFWFCVGLHNLSVSLLYGKLVQADVRGRLMLLTTTFGAAVAIFSAWCLMTKWLAGGTSQFMWLFLTTGVAFVAAGLIALLLSESPDSTHSKANSFKQTISLAASILRTDRNFRLLALVAAMFGASITLFPHYQAYVRQNLNLGLESFVTWVIAQNLGAAAFSIPLGRAADRFGNRLALQWTMILLCLAPILTMVWINIPSGQGQFGFQLVFFLLGLTPVTMRTFNNYTLEICDRDRQPIYLTTLGFCLALPVILFSTLVGALVDVIGFELVFSVVVAILFLGWLLTFMLEEPRSSSSSGPRPKPGRPPIGLE